jgi:hypothetical protein
MFGNTDESTSVPLNVWVTRPKLPHRSTKARTRQVGKLTDTTVNHRAAIITLKLVNERGGEARANTQWSVLTPGGDAVKESTGAFPRVILAEGEYRAVARNENRTYEREFRVIAGVDGEIEVLSR